VAEYGRAGGVAPDAASVTAPATDAVVAESNRAQAAEQALSTSQSNYQQTVNNLQTAQTTQGQSISSLSSRLTAIEGGQVYIPGDDGSKWQIKCTAQGVLYTVKVA
jgi:hypothetical protein